MSATTRRHSTEFPSYRHLSDQARRLLVAGCLVQGVADASALAFFSRQPDVPARFQGASAEQWRAAFGEAAGAGLVSPLGRGRYGLHPALPAYLAARWRREEPGDHDAARSAAITCLIAAYATLGGRIVNRIREGDAGRAVGVVGMERQNFGYFLGLALAAREWDLAHDIAQALNQYWDARGLLEEARGWVERVRQATEGPGGTPPGLDTPAGALWLFAVSSQASRQLQARRLEEAEAMERDLLAMLDAQPPSTHRQRQIARAYHNLGVLSQSRGRLDDAEAWYCRSLEVREELMGRSDMAETYRDLGMAARGRGRLDDAGAWQRRSLEIQEGRRNCPGMAMTDAALRRLREERQRLSGVI